MLGKHTAVIPSVAMTNVHMLILASGAAFDCGPTGYNQILDEVEEGPAPVETLPISVVTGEEMRVPLVDADVTFGASEVVLDVIYVKTLWLSVVKVLAVTLPRLLDTSVDGVEVYPEDVCEAGIDRGGEMVKLL